MLAYYKLVGLGLFQLADHLANEINEYYVKSNVEDEALNKIMTKWMLLVKN